MKNKTKLSLCFSDGFHVTNSALHSLLSLPNLEKLDLMLSSFEFSFLKPLPEMKKLTELHLSFIWCSYTTNMKDLCNTLKKMPNLLKLRAFGLTLTQAMMLAREAIIAARSQKKSVIVEIGCYRPKMKIESKNYIEQTIVQTLQLDISGYSEKMNHEIMEFVQNNLEGYHAVLLGGK